jgi:hypothetical protein
MTTFEFRPLVETYFADQRVRSAVDELLSRRFGEGHAPHFEWEEFRSYVDAWLAAQQTAAEWAKDICDIWEQVWGVQLDGHCPLVPRPTATVTVDIASGGIREAWFDGWYSRVVRSRYGPVGLVVYGDTEEFNVQLEFEKKAPKLDLSEWSFDNEEIDSPTVALSRASGTTLLDLTTLQEEARRAIALLTLN